MNLIETNPTIKGRELTITLVNDFSLLLTIRELKYKKGKPTYKTLLCLQFSNACERENEEYQKFLTEEGFLDTDFPDIDIPLIQKYVLFLNSLSEKRKVLAIELQTKIQKEFEYMFSSVPDNIEKSFRLNTSTYRGGSNYAEIKFRIPIGQNGEGDYCDIIVGDRTDLRLNNKIFYDMLPTIFACIKMDNIENLMQMKRDFDKQTETIYDASYDLFKTTIETI